MNEIKASIITIGDELLIGQTIDTNSAYISQELNKIGIWVSKRIAVGDQKNEIISMLDEVANDAKLVILTGGLGPTADDITKPVLCEYFGGNLVTDYSVEQGIRKMFEKLGREVGKRNLKQAEVPESCTVLPNKKGTAPGMLFRKNGVIFISLPGVPHEMKGLMEDEVIPLLKQLPDLPAILHRNVSCSGVGESVVADHLESFETSLPSHIRLAYLPSYDMVKLRLTAKGKNEQVLAKEMDRVFNELKNKVRTWFVAEGEIPLAGVINELLLKTNKTLSTAESCTGGYIAHLITSVAGSSAVYKGTVVAYSNEVKSEVLCVDTETIETEGAVSEHTVTAMVQGVIRKLKTDYGIATSGIMGPGGGSEEKPAGTVWIAAGNKKRWW